MLALCTMPALNMFNLFQHNPWFPNYVLEVLINHISMCYHDILCMYINCSSALWSSLAGVNVEVNPCRVRTDDVLIFYGFVAREAITQPLNLTDARY